MAQAIRAGRYRGTVSPVPLLRGLGAGVLGRVERDFRRRGMDRAELLLVRGEVLADAPDDVEHRRRGHPDPRHLAVRRPDQHLTLSGPALGGRLAAHEEVERELVQGVPDRQAVGIGPGFQGGIEVGLELDLWLCRWLAHPRNATLVCRDRWR